jgi:hypothetical protein
VVPLDVITFKPRPKTDLIVLHDTHTPHGSIANVGNWLTLEARRKGLLCVGYHFVITSKGLVIMPRPTDAQGSHCRGFNHRSVGVCLEGNSAEPTEDQMVALKATLAYNLQPLYGKLPLMGHSELGHHRFVNPQACPALDMGELRRVLMAPTL